MQPTIKDVAERAGVSIASVSRMMNDSNNIAAETAKAIQEAIDELGYKPIRKKKIKRNRDRQIGFVMPDTALYTFGSTIRDITSILLEEDYDLRIINLDHVRKITAIHVEMLLNKRLSGVIFYGCYIDKNVANLLNEADLPAVVFQGSSPHLVSVSVNNYNGITNAVQYMISRGYKKIAFVGWKHTDFNVKARLDAFKNTMVENKLDSSLIFLDDLNRRGGNRATAEAWETSRPEAIMYAADILAYGGYRYFKENGIVIPDDVGIMGFDDAYLSEVIGLTTMYQLLDAKLRIVMEHLLRMINEKKPAQPEEVLITPRLIVRTSLK